MGLQGGCPGDPVAVGRGGVGRWERSAGVVGAGRLHGGAAGEAAVVKGGAGRCAGRRVLTLGAGCAGCGNWNFTHKLLRAPVGAGSCCREILRGVILCM